MTAERILKRFAQKLDERRGKTRAALKAFSAPLRSIILYWFRQTKHVHGGLLGVSQRCLRGLVMTSGNETDDSFSASLFNRGFGLLNLNLMSLSHDNTCNHWDSPRVKINDSSSRPEEGMHFK